MPTRRRLLAGAAGLLATPAIVETVGAQSAFDWKRFKGTEIEVTLTLNPRADILQKNQKEFEELTGIRVGSEQIPEQQQRQKIVIELASGRPSFDVTMVSLHVTKRTLGKAKWLTDLRPLLADPTLTAPDFDYADFTPGGLSYVTQADGRIDSLPMFIDLWVLYWNKQIFQEAGLGYPSSMDEMLATARKLTVPGRQQYGFVGRGLKNANIPVWTSWLLGQGQETVSPDGKLLTDTAEAIWAGELYKTLMRECAPPGSIGFNWNESQTSFAQGRAAMWLDGIGFTPPLEDPAKSRIVGKVGFGVTPPGPKAQHSAMFGSSLGVAAASRKQGAAYFYCQWATGKANLRRVLQTGSGAPPRRSPFQDPALMASSRFGREWFETLLKSNEIARPGLPEIIPVTEFRDTFGIALTNMIGGADVAAELRRATNEFRPVLERSEQG
ncbi:MAG: sugar ABC transporter substrate-binding protein [Acetobacteraceae bacterium]|nr:sugar ABC transporter substrate-binding protein [Acetobacteraceae bacterium]